MARTLPPPGSPGRDIAGFVDQLVDECQQNPLRQAFLTDADRGFNLYLGNHFTNAERSDTVRFVLNRVQNAIVALMALQAADKPKPTFTPRETGEPPVYYLNTEIPQGKAILAQMRFAHASAIGMAAVPLDAPGPDAMRPLAPDIAERIKQAIEAGQVMAAQSAADGLPPPPGILPPDLLIEVTDASSSQALQTVVDALWEQGDAQSAFVENILNKNIYGWQPTLVEFDDREKRPTFTNVHPMHVYPDNLRPESNRWHYAVHDQPLSADEACAKFPHLAEAIRREARPGSLLWPGNRSGNVALMYDQQFQRDMVVLRTAWFAFQPYPMRPEDAVADQRVDLRDIPTGDVDPATNDFVYRAAMFERDGKDEINVGHKKWPLRYGVRQITILAGEKIDDREAEWPEIPMPANRNIPIPHSPYGQSEGKRLEDIQMAINYCLTAAVTHQRYAAYPPEFIPEEILAKLEGKLKDAYTKPGQRIGIPRKWVEEFQDIRKIIQRLDPPTIPEAGWRLLSLLLELIDRESGNNDVMQGAAAAQWSGETVKALQGAASQIIKGKSIFTEQYLKRITRLLAHVAVNRLTPADWKRYLSGKPIQAIAALHTRAKALDIDISVEISSGSGASKAGETQNLIAAKQSGIPIADPEIMERLGVDPDAQLQKQTDWMRKLPPAPSAPSANNDQQPPKKSAANNGGKAA